MHTDPLDVSQAVLISVQHKVPITLYLGMFKSLGYILDTFLWLFNKKKLLLAVKYSAQGNTEDLFCGELSECEHIEEERGGSKAVQSKEKMMRGEMKWKANIQTRKGR